MTVLTLPLSWGINGVSGQMREVWVKTLYFRPLLTAQVGGKKWPEMIIAGTALAES